MKKLTISAQVPEKKDAAGVVTQVAIGPFTVSIDVPETAKEMIDLYGDEAVKTNALANWIVTLQSNMRSGMKKGETNAAMQGRLVNAKMGAAAGGVKVDPEQAYLAMLMSATPEQRNKMIADLKARAAGAAGVAK